MKKRIYILLSILVLAQLPLLAQDIKTPYFGLDLGPKYDRYVHEFSSNEYRPNIEIISDIGANAGIIGGVMFNKDLLFEVGFYKNDYKMKLNFISDQGNVFFRNSLVRTITSIGVPISVHLRLKKSTPRHQWYAGVGFMPLMNVKTEQDQLFQSVVEEIQNDKKEVIDKMAYSVSEQKIDGSIVTANLSLRYNFSLNKNLAFHTQATVRMGVSGRNEFSISHSTLNYSSIQNKFFTKGGGYNLNIGFRYFLFQEEE